MRKPLTTVVATPQKVGISVLFDVVCVEFICGDDYAAQVLYDDLIDRLRAGEGLTISVKQTTEGMEAAS